MELFYCGDQWGYTPLGNTANIPTVTCLPPIELSVAVTNQYALFKWKAQHDYSSFELNYRIVGNPAWIVVPVFGTSINIELSANGIYEWRVKTVCSNILSSAFVNGLNFTAGNYSAACTQVLVPFTLYNDGTDYYAQWNDTGALYYKVFICVFNQDCTTSYNTSYPNIKIPNTIIPGVDYKMRVVAYCKNGSAAPTSQWFYFTLDDLIICPAPIKLIATSGETYLYLSWFPGYGSNPDSYNIYLDGVLVAAYYPLTDFSFNNLVPNQTYTLSVIANCGKNHSLPAVVVKKTTTLNCQCNIIPIAVSLITATSARIDWTVACTGTNALLDFKLIVNNGVPIYIAAGTTFYVFSGYPSNSALNIILTSRCANNELSVNSAYTIIQLSGCADPVFNTVQYANDNMTFSWSGPQNAIRYNINILKNGVLQYSTTVTTQSATILNVQKGISYTAQVTSVCMINGVEVLSATVAQSGTYVVGACVKYNVVITRVDAATANITITENTIGPYTGSARILVTNIAGNVVYKSTIVSGPGTYSVNGLTEGVSYLVYAYAIKNGNTGVYTLDDCTTTPTQYDNLACWPIGTGTLTFLGPTTLQIALTAAAFTINQTKVNVSYALDDGISLPANLVYSTGIDVPKANFPYNLTIPGYGRYAVKLIADCNGADLAPVFLYYSCPPITSVLSSINGTTLTGAILPNVDGYHSYKITVTALGLASNILSTNTNSFEIRDLLPGKTYTVKVELVCAYNPEILSAPYIFTFPTGRSSTTPLCAPPQFTTFSQDCGITTPPGGGGGTSTGCTVSAVDWILLDYYFISLPTTYYIEATFKILQDSGIVGDQLIPGGIVGEITNPLCLPLSSSILSLELISGGTLGLSLSATLDTIGSITANGSYTPTPGVGELYVRIKGTYNKIT